MLDGILVAEELLRAAAAVAIVVSADCVNELLINRLSECLKVMS